MQNQLTVPTNPLSTHDGRVVISSLAVADILERRHKDILTSIRELLADDTDSESTGQTFRPVEYVDAKGEYRPAYEMSRDGFVFLVSRFTGSKAFSIIKSYVEKFNEMEATLKKTKVFGYQMPSTVLELRWVLTCPRTCWNFNRMYLGIMADSADLDPVARAAFTRGIGIADDAMRTSTRPEGPEAWRRFWKRWKDLEDERLDAKQDLLTSEQGSARIGAR